MLGVALIQVATAIAGVYFGSKAAMAFGRDLRRGVFRKVTSFSAKDVNVFGAPTLITRGTNDVQQVQMLVLMGLNFMVATPIMCIGGIIMALREDLSLSWLVLGVRSGADCCGGIPRGPPDAALPFHADENRPHQRHSPRADHWHPRGPGLRPGTARQCSVLVGKPRTHRCLAQNWRFVRPYVPGHWDDFHVSTAAVLWFGGQRVDAGEMQVGSLTAFLQYLLSWTYPDPRHDDHVHGHDGSAGLGLRGPHRRGARR